MEQYIFVLKEMYNWYRKGLALLGLEALKTSLLVSKLHLNNNKLEWFEQNVSLNICLNLVVWKEEEYRVSLHSIWVAVVVVMWRS